jgi:hypothetical protein
VFDGGSVSLKTNTASSGSAVAAVEGSVVKSTFEIDEGLMFGTEVIVRGERIVDDVGVVVVTVVIGGRDLRRSAIAVEGLDAIGVNCCCCFCCCCIELEISDNPFISYGSSRDEFGGNDGRADDTLAVLDGGGCTGSRVSDGRKSGAVGEEEKSRSCCFTIDDVFEAVLFDCGDGEAVFVANVGVVE